MNARGFTLIELMVAVTIFAIISAIAIPLYTQYSQRSFRTESMSDLMNCGQALERGNAINFTYVGANPGGDGTALDVAVCNPNSNLSGRYAITATTTVNGYDLLATPAGAMAGTGILTLDQAGNRGWDESDPSDGDTTDAGEDNWEEG